MSELAVLEAPDTTDLENEGNEIVERAEAFIVNGPESYVTAGTMMVAFKGVVKAIKERLDPIVTKAHQAHKAMTQLRNDATAPYTAAEGKLKNKMIDWRREEDARVRREQEAADREQRRLAEEQARKAEELRQANMPEAAEAMVAAEPPAPARVVRSAIPKVKGVSVSKTWKYRVVDGAAVKRAFLILNEPLIRDIVKRMGHLAQEQVGGIEVYEDETMAGRTR